MKDGPSDAAYHISKNEWSNEELFVVWLKHFTKFVKPSKEDSDILTRTLLKEQLLEKKEKHEKNKNKKLLKNDFKPKTVVEVKKRKMEPSQSSSSSDEDVQLRDFSDDVGSEESDVEEKCIIQGDPNFFKCSSNFISCPISISDIANKKAFKGL
jgi:hypothetical protein